jgi:hypothetical protein
MNDDTSYSAVRLVDHPAAGDDVASARLLFLVRAVGELWEVSIGGSPDSIQYRFEDEALGAARRAALRHWRRRHESTGVQVDGELLAGACWGE